MCGFVLVVCVCGATQQAVGMCHARACVCACVVWGGRGDKGESTVSAPLQLEAGDSAPLTRGSSGYNSM